MATCSTKMDFPRLAFVPMTGDIGKKRRIHVNPRLYLLRGGERPLNGAMVRLLHVRPIP